MRLMSSTSTAEMSRSASSNDSIRRSVSWRRVGREHVARLPGGRRRTHPSSAEQLDVLRSEHRARQDACRGGRRDRVGSAPRRPAGPGGSRRRARTSSTTTDDDAVVANLGAGPEGVTEVSTVDRDLDVAGSRSRSTTGTARGRGRSTPTRPTAPTQEALQRCGPRSSSGDRHSAGRGPTGRASAGCRRRVIAMMLVRIAWPVARPTPSGPPLAWNPW